MSYLLESVVRALRNARTRKNLSQRRLAVKVGVPQSHLSNIENARVDLKVSSLIELARALDLEVMLVPRRLVPAVESLSRGLEHGAGDPRTEVREPTPAYRLGDEEDTGDG